MVDDNATRAALRAIGHEVQLAGESARLRIQAWVALHTTTSSPTTTLDDNAKAALFDRLSFWTPWVGSRYIRKPPYSRGAVAMAHWRWLCQIKPLLVCHVHPINGRLGTFVAINMNSSESIRHKESVDGMNWLGRGVIYKMASEEP